MLDRETHMIIEILQQSWVIEPLSLFLFVTGKRKDQLPEADEAAFRNMKNFNGSVPVFNASNGAFTEFHHIPRQGSCFVWEYVFDLREERVRATGEVAVRSSLSSAREYLSQLFVKVGGSGHGRSIWHLIIHFQVLKRETELHDLRGMG